MRRDVLQSFLFFRVLHCFYDVLWGLGIDSVFLPVFSCCHYCHVQPHRGPNLYEVNEHYVKPVTRKAGGMSYALMKHPQGLLCQVFISHAWAEGAGLFCDVFLTKLYGLSSRFKSFGQVGYTTSSLQAYVVSVSIILAAEEPLKTQPLRRCLRSTSRLTGVFELGDHVKRAWPRLQRLHNLYLECPSCSPLKDSSKMKA